MNYIYSFKIKTKLNYIAFINVILLNINSFTFQSFTYSVTVRIIPATLCVKDVTKFVCHNINYNYTREVTTSKTLIPSHATFVEEFLT